MALGTAFKPLEHSSLMKFPLHFRWVCQALPDADTLFMTNVILEGQHRAIITNIPLLDWLGSPSYNASRAVPNMTRTTRDEATYLDSLVRARSSVAHHAEWASGLGLGSHAIRTTLRATCSKRIGLGDGSIREVWYFTG